jgi:hypothetical protein
MSNTFLTPSMITREALRVLHAKVNFIGSINRQYDSSFAQEGAKIGGTLRIRKPPRYIVSDGANLQVQDYVDEQVPLTISTQKHVGLQFTTADMTLSLDDFSARVIVPAVSVLATVIEADVLTNVYKDVYQQVNGNGSAQTFRNTLLGRKILNDSLAPSNDRMVRLNTLDNVDLVDSLKGLFQSSEKIKRQYDEGVMGYTAGFEFAENTQLPRHTNGARVATTYLVNGANQSGAGLIVDTGTGAMKKGDVFTIANVFRVHPETKQTTNVEQQFVVTADYVGGAGTIAISPAIVLSGGQQNVNAAPADNAQLTFVGAASSSYGLSLAYQKDAFTFATADLVLPKGVDMAAREVMDGISMRLVRDYVIGTDTMACRLDVLYGYTSLRPELAVRLAAN